MVIDNGHDEDKYFITPSARIVFHLLHTDGQVRMKALKIEKKHYSDRKAAEEWQAGIISHIQEIREDLGKEVFQVALNEVDSQFRLMTKFGE